MGIYYYWCFIWSSISNNALDFEDGVGCDVMTIQDKITQLNEYCDSHTCQYGDYLGVKPVCKFDRQKDSWCGLFGCDLIKNEELVNRCYSEIATHNPYWENITAIANKQRKKGLRDYGQGLEDNPAPILDRIQHIEEELVDALMYLEWLKESVESGRK